MRIMIVASASPFTGREEIHWAEALRNELIDQNHEVDLFMLPIVHNPLLIPEQMTALRLIDIKDSSDLLITVGFPAFLVKHPHKRVLLFSLAPSLHEHFDTEYGILATPQYQRIRDAVHKAEKNCLSEAERIICASITMSEQLLADHQLRSDIVILGDCSKPQSGEYISKDHQPWIVCETTLEPFERIDLLLRSLRYAEQKWSLLITIPSCSAVYQHAINDQLKRFDLKGRVKINNVPLTSNHLNSSYAIIALNYSSTRIPESLFRAGKLRIPIITTADSGALCEIVINGVNGLVIDPKPEAVAIALDSIAIDKNLKRHPSLGNHIFSHIVTNAKIVCEKIVN